MGRISGYSARHARTICNRLAAGESLRAICRDDKMPGLTTVWRWLRTSEQFRADYAEARARQAETLADDILEIADDARNDWMAGREEGSLRANPESVQRSKLRIDARKWLAGQLAPRKYGEAMLHRHADAEGRIRPMDDVEKLTRILSILQRARPDDDPG